MEVCLGEGGEVRHKEVVRSMVAGGTLGSYSTISGNAQGRTPSSGFIFDGDITYQKYWGPGTEGIPQTEIRQDGVRARYENWGKERTDLSYAEVALRESSTALAILSNLHIATTAQDYLANSTILGRIERHLNP